MKDLLIRLAKSNALAQEYATRLMGNRKYRDFRKILSRFVGEQPISDQDRQMIESICKEDLTIICDAEHLKDAFANKMQFLAQRVANIVSSKVENDGGGGDKGNIIGQAKMYLLNAIYGYNNPEVEFTTYAYHVVKNELNRYVLLQHTGLSSGSMDMVDTKRAFLRAEAELLAKAVSPTFHNIAEHLHYDERDQKKLMGVMASIGNLGDHQTPSGGSGRLSDTYLVETGIKMYEEDEEARAAVETCDFIEQQILANETERTIFREMRRGLSLPEVANQLGLSLKDARSVFDKIKRKTRRYYEEREVAA